MCVCHLSYVEFSVYMTLEELFSKAERKHEKNINVDDWAGQRERAS